MRRRILVLALVAGLMVGTGAVVAFALSPPGSQDPGPYTACVNSRTGAIRMVASSSPTCTAREYAIGWSNSINGYGTESDSSEPHTTATQWFRQLPCPEGSEPLGGGGAFLPDTYQAAAEMVLQSSVPTLDEDLGGLHGWEVSFNSVDGLPHTGTFQIFVTCAPAVAG